MIESSTNAQIKKIQKLKKSARNRRKEGLFIAEGVRLVEDALAYRMVEKVYLSENVKEEYFDRLSHKLKEADIEYVSSKCFRKSLILKAHRAFLLSFKCRDMIGLLL